MRILLDTHALLWNAEGNPSLSEEARRAIASTDNEITVSIASLWEMAIKVGLGKLKPSKPLSAIVEDAQRFGVVILPILPAHALAVEKLPMHHRDPFDRMLVAQAMAENLVLVTRDPAFEPYSIRCLW